MLGSDTCSRPAVGAQLISLIAEWGSQRQDGLHAVISGLDGEMRPQLPPSHETMFAWICSGE
jgi:hypothetical protein